MPGERNELLRSIESSSDNIDTIANIVAYMAEYRGMGAEKPKEVIAPAREITRRRVGAEGLAMLDALFEEQLPVKQRTMTKTRIILTRWLWSVLRTTKTVSTSQQVLPQRHSGPV